MAGFGSVSISTPVSAVDAAAAAAPSAVPTVTSGKEEAARAAAMDAVVAVASSAEGGLTTECWGGEVLPGRVPRWGSAAPNVPLMSTIGAATSAVAPTTTSALHVSWATEAPAVRA